MLLNAALSSASIRAYRVGSERINLPFCFKDRDVKTKQLPFRFLVVCRKWLSHTVLSMRTKPVNLVPFLSATWSAKRKLAGDESVVFPF